MTRSSQLSPKQAQPESAVQEREAFEAWGKKRNLNLTVYGDGNYDDFTDELWRAWLARGEWERAKESGSAKSRGPCPPGYCQSAIDNGDSECDEGGCAMAYWYSGRAKESGGSGG